MKSTLKMVLLSQNFLFFAKITSCTANGIYGTRDGYGSG